jgi:hypothetical protein
LDAFSNVVGDYIVEDFYGTNPSEGDSTTTSSDGAGTTAVAGDGVQLY